MLRIPAVLPDSVRALLSADERAAVGRYRHQRDAVRFAVGRGALRQLLGGYLGRAADTVEIDRTCRLCGAPDHGKPHVQGDAGLDFNASSSGDCLVIGVARDLTLGVDVEVIAEATVQALSEGDASARTPELVQAWCAKEAVLKATGHGLAIDPRAMAVAHEDGLWRVCDAPGDAVVLRQFLIAPLAIDVAHVAAVAMRPAAHRLRLFTLELAALSAIARVA